MTGLFWRAAALAYAAIPTMASAQPIGEAKILSGQAVIEADSGYVFVTGRERQMGTLLRMPEAEDVAQYEEEWAKQLARVQKKYPSKLASWESKKATAEQTKAKVPDRPIEPTAENFSIEPIESQNAATFGYMSIYNKSATPRSFSYLTKMKPGRYVYHGPLWTGPEGSMGTCYCMGSVAFDVKPGVITNIGNFFAVAASAGQSAAASVDLAAVNYDLPASLQALPHVQAEFYASGKFDNFFRGTVGRMPAVAGVLAYDRDKVIDAKTGQMAAGMMAADAPPRTAADAETTTDAAKAGEEEVTEQVSAHP